MAQFQSTSPPPLRHPVPTHPAYIPEPPSTPVSPQGYQRFTSSPGPGQHQTQQQLHNVYLQNHGHGAAIPQPQAYGTHTPSYYAQPQPVHGYQPVPVPGQGNMNTHGHVNGGGGGGGGGGVGQDYGAWGSMGIDGATAQLGMQLGSSAVAAGQEYMQKNFGTLFPSTYLQHHFNVSNSYVMHKLRLVLFPWTHKPWSRQVKRTENGQTEWQTPREDINSPDLYIPVMAIVTYILLTAIHKGLERNFNPKILGDSASRAIAVVLLDFVFVKLGCYVLNIQGSSQVVDLIAYGGYKFVGVIVTITASFLKFSGPLWMLVFVYCFLANAFFLLRSLRSVVLPDPSISISTNPNPTTTATVTPAQRRRRITFLFFEAVLQILYMTVLVRI